jgi:hypothetical protein
LKVPGIQNAKRWSSDGGVCCQHHPDGAAHLRAARLVFAEARLSSASPGAAAGHLRRTLVFDLLLKGSTDLLQLLLAQLVLHPLDAVRLLEILEGDGDVTVNADAAVGTSAVGVVLQVHCVMNRGDLACGDFAFKVGDVPDGVGFCFGHGVKG